MIDVRPGNHRFWPALALERRSVGWWADPGAGYVLLYYAAREGRTALGHGTKN